MTVISLSSSVGMREHGAQNDERLVGAAQVAGYVAELPDDAIVVEEGVQVLEDEYRPLGRGDDPVEGGVDLVAFVLVKGFVVESVGRSPEVYSLAELGGDVLERVLDALLLPRDEIEDGIARADGHAQFFLEFSTPMRLRHISRYNRSWAFPRLMRSRARRDIPPKGPSRTRRPGRSPSR